MVGGVTSEEEQYFKRDYDSSSSEEEGKKPMKYVPSGVTEKYYITDDEWDVLLPKLNTPKSGISLCKY
jgi:hypothetical protein